MADNSYAQLIDDFEKGLLVIKGESLTDYIKRMGGVDYDAKANGGLMYLKKGGKVVDIMPKSMSWKGKAKDYPGAKNLKEDDLGDKLKNYDGDPEAI